MFVVWMGSESSTLLPFNAEFSILALKSSLIGKAETGKVGMMYPGTCHEVLK